VSEQNRRASRSSLIIAFLALGSLALLLLANALLVPQAPLFKAPRHKPVVASTPVSAPAPVPPTCGPTEEPPTVAPTAYTEVNSTGFAAQRVRAPHLAENWEGSPESYLTESRIVLRSMSVSSNGTNMRISGRLWSDFEVEGGRGFDAGQLLGLAVKISLHEQATDQDDKLGPIVPGQSSVAKIDTVETEGDLTLGTGTFTLPVLAKPLPPGIYRLACRLEFREQPQNQKDALMWVRDMYGVYMEYHADGKPLREGTPVYGSKHHRDYWREIVENEVCRSNGTLFLGNTLKSGAVSLTRENCLCRDASYVVYKSLEMLAKQRTELDEAYETRKRNPDADLKRLKDPRDAEVRSLNMLVARNGGRMRLEEDFAFMQVNTAMFILRGEIIAFEDDLALNYWIALDVFHYYFHTVNKLGYNCYVAIDKGDNTVDRKAREARQEKLRENQRDHRARAFKFIPEPIRKANDDYRRRSEETGELDSAAFTRKQGKEVSLDPAKWSAWRVKFLAEFKTKSDALVAPLDVSNSYAIQKWGTAYRQALEVRDAVITHAFCYEYYLRMIPIDKQVSATGDKTIREAADKAIVADWETEAGENLKTLQPLLNTAKNAPATVSARYETASKQSKKTLDIEEFAYRYSLSVQKLQVPPPRRFKVEK
jgi:hypothetical protein